ncbi:CurL C-terminal domain-containing protein, partial [Mycobacterium sp. MUNTM1]
TNAHAVLEQAPEPSEGSVAGDASTGEGIEGGLVFPVSASSEDALRQTAARLADWVDAQGSDFVIRDLAYTLALRRGHRQVRTAVLA